MGEEIPRKNRMDLWCEAEKKTQLAVDEVEKMPASPTLTNAIILLGQAREAIAAFVDSPEGFKFRMKQAKPA